ncbi:hypothetical protein [Brucella pseudogrignonensis]|uniref:hypothetical protein n=1 Tax=Brucella pseudogrignonensis TaxID=419475 RepID=UPI003ECF7CE9
MVGQNVELTGVTAAAGRAVIDMNAADRVAARLGVKHVFSPRTFKKIAAGGVSGRCRATGAEFLGVGTGFSALTLKNLAGITAVSPQSGHEQIAGFRLPAGSATPSYTVVMAIALGIQAASTTEGFNSELVGSYNASNTWLSYMARYRSEGNTGSNEGFICAGPNQATPVAYIGTALMPPANNWLVVAFEWDDDNGVIKTFHNSGLPVQTEDKAVKHAVGDNGYLMIGHPTGAGGIRDNYLSDIYFFDRPLSRNIHDNAALSDLIAAMKSVHGIA